MAFTIEFRADRFYEGWGKSLNHWLRVTSGRFTSKKKNSMVLCRVEKVAEISLIRNVLGFRWYIINLI